MNTSNTMTEQIKTETGENELSVEERLAQIAAAVAAKTEADETPKVELAPFTCSMDPAERALCDACQ